MLRCILAGALLAAGMMAATGAMAAWQSGEDNRGAWSRIQSGVVMLQITCRRNDPRFFFTLSGGPFNGMKNADDQSDSMMIWIELPDGRTGRHAIDGHYVGMNRPLSGASMCPTLCWRSSAMAAASS
ncbi:MAG: hypothetical protein AAGH68_08240 [Pseudomonadota bacterium]